MLGCTHQAIWQESNSFRGAAALYVNVKVQHKPFVDRLTVLSVSALAARHKKHALSIDLERIEPKRSISCSDVSRATASSYVLYDRGGNEALPLMLRPLFVCFNSMALVITLFLCTSPICLTLFHFRLKKYIYCGTFQDRSRKLNIQGVVKASRMRTGQSQDFWFFIFTIIFLRPLVTSARPCSCRKLVKPTLRHRTIAFFSTCIDALVPGDGVIDDATVSRAVHHLSKMNLAHLTASSVFSFRERPCAKNRTRKKIDPAVTASETLDLGFFIEALSTSVRSHFSNSIFSRNKSLHYRNSRSIEIS